jgi:dTDP-4-amino-4,6-dideoxygalactose transaminase
MKRIVYGAPTPTEEMVAAVSEVIRSGWWGAGDLCEQLEGMLRAVTRAPYAVSVSSGSAALHSILMGAGVGLGDEVVTTPITYAATAHAIGLAGARPIFAEIDPVTGNLDPKAAEAAIRPRTAAILAVHLYGRPFDPRLIEICSRKHILLIEDAAHAVGASTGGMMAGSMGDAAAFSFNYQKNVAAAEAGALTTRHAHISAAARQFAHNGEKNTTWERYKGKLEPSIVSLGTNYRPNDISAAMTLDGFSRFSEIQANRERIWKAYDRHLEAVPVVPPARVPPGMIHARHIYNVRVPVDRMEVQRKLSAAGIGSGIHYKPVHLEPYYREKYGHKGGELPFAEAFGKSTLSLPMSPSLTDQDVERVALELSKSI